MSTTEWAITVNMFVCVIAMGFMLLCTDVRNNR